MSDTALTDNSTHLRVSDNTFNVDIKQTGTWSNCMF